jgi:hypothetical protein
MGHRFGLVGTQSVSFRWSEVTDPSGITYTIEVADNYDFLPNGSIMTKEGLTEASYTYDITPGAYYWRIKAVDGAGNESEWKPAPYPFVVAELSNYTHEFIALLKKAHILSIVGFIIAGLIVLRIIVLLIQAWLQRRRRYYY